MFTFFFFCVDFYLAFTIREVGMMSVYSAYKTESIPLFFTVYFCLASCFTNNVEGCRWFLFTEEGIIFL